MTYGKSTSRTSTSAKISEEKNTIHCISEEFLSNLVIILKKPKAMQSMAYPLT
jgi:hypothetical protein